MNELGWTFSLQRTWEGPGSSGHTLLAKMLRMAAEAAWMCLVCYHPDVNNRVRSSHAPLGTAIWVSSLSSTYMVHNGRRCDRLSKK